MTKKTHTIYRALRDLKHVPRWTIVPTNKNQSVAEHSYYVAIITGLVCEMTANMNDEQKLMALKYALVHDVDEAITGDIPALVKKKMGNTLDAIVGNWLPTIKPEDEKVCKVVKICDVLEALWFIIEEIEMGNGSVVNHIYRQLETKLRKLCGEHAWSPETIQQTKSTISYTVSEQTRRACVSEILIKRVQKINKMKPVGSVEV